MFLPVATEPMTHIHNGPTGCTACCLIVETVPIDPTYDIRWELPSPEQVAQRID